MASCSGREAVEISVPKGPAAGCARLADELPDELDGRERLDTVPTSPRTAAWGDPPVVLRCGVERPPGLRGSEVTEVDGVGWVLAERPAAYVFTTVGLPTYVEVSVPDATPRTRAANPLVDLADPLRDALGGSAG